MKTNYAVALKHAGEALLHASSVPNPLYSFLLTLMIAVIAGCGGNGAGGPPATVKSIAVTPASATITAGATQHFAATATYSDGSSKDVTANATWGASSAAATVASTGLATGVSVGSVTITASVSSVSGTAALTVTAALESVAVTPTAPALTAGATQQFTATGTYSDATKQDLTTRATWTSSSTTVASITPSGGLATAAGTGTTIITATASGKSATTVLTVTTAQATVKNQVVDSALGRPLSGLVLKFTTGAVSATATTDNHGSFSLPLSPGAYSLIITQGITPLLTTTVTVGADGSMAQYPTSIAVTLPANPIATFLRQSTPPHAALSITPSAPTSGQSVTVVYTDATSTATSVTVTFTGAGCGALTGAQVTGAKYQQVAAVADAGTCQAVATVAFPSGAQTLTTQFRVEPSSVTLPALSIAGSSFMAGDSLPAPVNFTGSTSLASVTPPGTLINGAVERYVVVPAGEPSGAKIISFLVQVPSVAGYFSVPARQDSGGNYYFDLVLNQDYFTTNDGTSGISATRGVAKHISAKNLTSRGRIGAAALAASDDGDGASLTVNVETADSQGNISTLTTNTSATRQVGAGTLQISLSWDTLVDLDLHVIEPDGEEIAWDNPTAHDGGTLDLDSNPICNIDGINNENVTWPSPAVPTPTTGNQKYTVRVDYYAACPDQSVNYQVTVNNCSAIAQFSGSFDASQADGDSGTAGVTITTFPFSDCNGSTVAGRVTYDDYQASAAGLSPTPTPLPIRDATVQVRADSDQSLLQTGSTDDNGNFNLTFKNATGTPGYYLSISAASPAADTTVVQQVTSESGSVYAYVSPMYDETAKPNNTGLSLAVTLEEGAPAFNIYDQGVSAFRFMAPFVAGLGIPTKLTWIWDSGLDSVDCPGSSCWIAEKKAVEVTSTAESPDEYYDSIMLHEFGHYFQFYFGSQSNPGGSHSFAQRNTPTLAWSEGFATFFGQTVKGSADYIDVYANGDCVCLNLDVPLASTIPLGTEDASGHTPADQNGLVSEAVVGPALWNLAKQFGSIPVFVAADDMVVLAYPAATLRDVGGWDAVDFLDTWTCLGHPKGTATTGFEGLVNGSLKFPYDYLAPCLPAPTSATQSSVKSSPSHSGAAQVHWANDALKLHMSQAARAKSAGTGTAAAQP